VISKLLTIGILASTIGVFANAQQPDPGVEIPMTLRCFAYETGHALEEGFGELPFVQGNGDINMGDDRSVPIEMTLHVNPDNKSWTLMYKLNDKLNCVAAGGEGTFRPAGTEPDGIRM